MNKKITVGLVILIVLILGVSALNQSGHANKPDIKVGAVLSLTGSAAVDSLNIKRGLELAKEDLLKKGYKVDIAYEDDETNPAKTVSSINKILLSKPDFIVGPTWSFLSDAGGPVIDAAKIIAYQPANTSEHVNIKSSYYFYGSNKNSEKEEPIYNWLKENSKKRVAIVVDSGAWGESHLKAFNDAVERSGGQVIMTERVPFGSEKDVIPTLLAKIVAEKADVILWTGFDEGTTILLKKKQEQHINIPVLAATEIPKKLKADNVVKIDEQDKVYVITTSISDEFAKKFYEKYGENPGAYADRAYDGLMLMVDAINKNGGTQNLSEYLKDKVDYKGYATAYNFNENGDIVGGKWIIEQLK